MHCETTWPVLAMPKRIKLVDLSGYMFSGKAAVSDLLREFEGISVPNNRVEFDLLRISGGLIDLRNAVEDWSPIRTHSALNRFERTVRRLSLTPGFPDKLFVTGYGYESIYPQLLASLDQFLQEAILLEWETPWPYDDLDDDQWETFLRKINAKLGRHKVRRYRLTCPDKFMPAAQRFVYSVLAHDVDAETYGMMITHNALESFDPARNLKLLGDDAQAIVVDRDPRDIYATAVTTQQGFNDNLEFFKRIAGAHDVRTFIDRYKVYRSMVHRSDATVLRLNFEDLVFDYASTVDRVCEFLGISREAHHEQFRYFDPEKSRVNTELWRREELSGFNDDFRAIYDQCMA